MSTYTKTKTFKLGITGNTSTGKSTVRKILHRLGVSTIDTHEIMISVATKRPEIRRQLTQYFGSDILDSYGNIIIKKLAEIRQNNPEGKEFLDNTVNRLIREEVKRFLYGPLGTFIRCVEAPQLFETDSEHLYDEVWTVTLTPEVQLKRVMSRYNLNNDQATQYIQSEMSQENKIGMSQRTIDNSGELAQTEQIVREYYNDVKTKTFSKF